MIDEQIKEQKALNKTSDTVKQNYNQYENLKKNLDAQANDLSTQQANLRVATLNYQAIIETAQDKKASLIKQRAAAEAVAKKEAEKAKKIAEIQAVAEETYKNQTRFLNDSTKELQIIKLAVLQRHLLVANLQIVQLPPQVKHLKILLQTIHITPQILLLAVKLRVIQIHPLQIIRAEMTQ